jgi:hypothetical protein
MSGLALLLLCQFIEPASPVVEVGSPVEVRAVDHAGLPISGLEIGVRLLADPAAPSAPIGTTGAAGRVAFAPPATGDYELRARLGDRGPLLVASVRAVPPPRRWLWAAFCVPLGLWFAWQHLRRRPPDTTRATGRPAP